MGRQPDGGRESPSAVLSDVLPWGVAVVALALLWHETTGWLALVLAGTALAVSVALVAGTAFDAVHTRAVVRPDRPRTPQVRPAERDHGPDRPWAA